MTMTMTEKKIRMTEREMKTKNLLQSDVETKMWEIHNQSHPFAIDTDIYMCVNLHTKINSANLNINIDRENGFNHFEMVAV